MQLLTAVYQLNLYMQMLVESFNVAAANNVMCRNTVNVGWDGRIFDCDFNQQLDMGMRYALDLTASYECQTSRSVSSVCYGPLHGVTSVCLLVLCVRSLAGKADVMLRLLGSHVNNHQALSV